MFGKDCGDLQESIAIEGGAMTGTLKYVTGYTGFSSKVEQQSGNFLAVKVVNESADEIYVGLNPSEGSGMVKLDADGIAVLRVANKDTQVLRIDAITGGIHDGLEINLEDLVCEEAEG